MDKEILQSEKGLQNPESPENNLILQFNDAINSGCQIFCVILAFFAFYLLFFRLNLVVQVLSFMEISNILNYCSAILRDYELTAVISGIILIVTGLFLYFRFFSNISRNDFSDDMGNYLRFYETLYSTFFDATILIILFLYLILVKKSYGEFIVILLMIVGLAYSIRKISVPYSKIIRDYSALKQMNEHLDEIAKGFKKKLEISIDSTSDLLFYGFLRKNSTWTTMALFFTIIIAILSISGEYNLITFVVLELVIIRYAFFQSQIGSLPRFLVTLHLEPNEIFNNVYIIKENRDLLLILTELDKFVIITKSQLKKVEPFFNFEET